MINYLLEHKKLYWLLLGLIFVLFRLPIWSGSYLGDFWIFNYVGHDWLNGGQLYITAWDHKAPTIFLIYGLLDKLWGNNLLVTHIFTTCLTLLDTFFFFKISQILFQNNPKRSYIALFAYTIVRNLGFLNVDGNITETYTLFLSNLALWLYLKHKEKINTKNILAIGTCFGIMLWLKVNSILLVLPITYYIFKQSNSLSKRMLNLLFLIIPTLLIGVLFCIYFYTQGTLKNFYVASFEYNSKYNWIGYFDYQYAKKFNLVSLGIAFIPFLYPIIIYFQRRNFSILHFYILAFGLFLCANSLFFPYYYLPFVTPLCLISTDALTPEN